MRTCAAAAAAALGAAAAEAVQMRDLRRRERSGVAPRRRPPWPPQHPPPRTPRRRPRLARADAVEAMEHPPRRERGGRGTAYNERGCRHRHRPRRRARACAPHQACHHMHAGRRRPGSAPPLPGQRRRVRLTARQGAAAQDCIIRSRGCRPIRWARRRRLRDLARRAHPAIERRDTQATRAPTEELPARAQAPEADGGGRLLAAVRVGGVRSAEYAAVHGLRAS